MSRAPLKQQQTKNVYLKIFVYLFLFAYPIYFSLMLLINPIHAPLPPVDKNQFINDWPAGYGIKEVVQFAQNQSQAQHIFIATEGTFGLTPQALDIYLQGNPNITTQGYWPIGNHMAEVIAQAKTTPTYVLFKDTQQPDPNWPLTLVSKYRKGDSQIYMSLYQVESN